MKSHYQVLIIGGGTGGIMTAAKLKRKNKHLSVAIIEPSKDHWYQPAWTLVGAGVFNFKSTHRPEATLIPAGVEWIKDYAETFQPEHNMVTTRNLGSISYDYLVVSPGIQNDIDALPGLREALQTDSVCSNYLDPQKTFEIIKNFKGGNAVFTQPATPIRCGGAPMKIMYLAESYFRKHGLRDKTNVIFATPGSVIFGVKEFAATLNKLIEERNVHFRPFYSPVKIDPLKKEITFKYSKPGGVFNLLQPDHVIHERADGENLVTIPYDMLHLAPPQSAPDFIKKSPLAYAEGNNKGWLNVNINTLQHNVYKNIFGIGDSAALPTAKTGAAIRKQAPVVVKNILHMIKNEAPSEQYSGYSSCPIVTDYGKMLLAEFKYNNVRDSDPLLSKLVDTTKDQWSMWLLKKYGLPWLYWNMMLKGRM
jgi:sulfide:quinone oxidoreductase